MPTRIKSNFFHILKILPHFTPHFLGRVLLIYDVTSPIDLGKSVQMMTVVVTRVTTAVIIVSGTDGHTALVNVYTHMFFCQYLIVDDKFWKCLSISKTLFST